ncbi:MAG: hypothetical protein K9J30_09175 [Bacteroidales bacterium]|nr:hypothetical protein [Bacteroidales bacterium]
MKRIINLSLIASFVLFITSCDPMGSNLPFSELSVEQNKQVVENSAVEAVQIFEGMTDVAAVEASISFGNYLSMADPMSDIAFKKTKFIRTVETVGGLQDNSTTINDMFALVTSPDELAEDPESVEDVWNEIVGIYSWNSATETWDYTANSEMVQFNFPSTEDGTTNNASFTISNYTGVYMTTTIDDEYTGDLPVSLDMDFVVDGTSVLSFTFAAEYNDDGVPSAMASDLIIEAYAFEVDMSNNDKKASASYKFTHDGETVIEISGKVEGDFTEENIEANTITHTETYEWTEYEYEWNETTNSYDEVEVTHTETYDWDELDVGEVFNSGLVKFQMMNISINAIGDIKALADSMNMIYPDDYWDDPNYDEKEATEREAAAINNTMDIFAIDEDAKTKIAEVEAYVVMETWGNDYYEFWIDYRLKFGDGSLVDMETYFEDGFEQVVAEINNMIYDLNSEYDLGIDTIEY